VGIFGDGEGAIRADFAFDATVDEEVIREADGSLDVNVIAENVTLSTGGGAAGRWSCFGRCIGGRGGGWSLRGLTGCWSVFRRLADDFFEHGW